jgi:hypothetical protein
MFILLLYFEFEITFNEIKIFNLPSSASFTIFMKNVYLLSLVWWINFIDYVTHPLVVSFVLIVLRNDSEQKLMLKCVASIQNGLEAVRLLIGSVIINYNSLIESV